ncbi:histidine phosphatase family protein [Flexivirga alba]|uniref:Histidine phosphatase family protein n=1 Tax=Flexivirga alba TaxID=702742 RepID=A0ABW2ALJ9_9MICO
MSTARMSAAPRRLVVWRHGETDYNATGRWQGQFDAPLSDRGRQQAAAAAKCLAAYDVSRIVASDLSRAADTARALADETGLTVGFDPRFREISVGSWAGLTTPEIRATQGDLLDRINAGEDLRRGETGETVAEVADRVVAGARDVIGQLEAGRPPRSPRTASLPGPCARRSPAYRSGSPSTPSTG